MRIILNAGDKLTVEIEGEDIVLAYSEDGQFTITTDMPDDTEREGIIYSAGGDVLNAATRNSAMFAVFAAIDSVLGTKLDGEDGDDLTEDGGIDGLSFNDLDSPRPITENDLRAIEKAIFAKFPKLNIGMSGLHMDTNIGKLVEEIALQISHVMDDEDPLDLLGEPEDDDEDPDEKADRLDVLADRDDEEADRIDALDD